MSELYQARYFDGQVATKHDVTLELSYQQLFGKNAKGELIFGCYYTELKVLQRGEDGRDAVIGFEHHSDARLYITQPLLAELEPKLPKQSVHISAGVKSVAVWIVVAILALFAVQQAIVISAPIIGQTMPREWREALGDYAFSSLVDEGDLCEDGATRYILAKMLARLAGKDSAYDHVKVQIVKDEQVNAFALPDDRIVFFSGLIEKAQSPEEVMGVLAHEMGHVKARHVTTGVVRNLGIIFAAELMLGSLGELGVAGQLLYIMQYGREAEEEADKIALELLVASDVNPEGLLHFFETLHEEEDHSHEEWLSYFSTHPATEDRINTMQWDRSLSFTPVLNSEEWDVLKKACR